MNVVFADTSYYIALVNANDLAHRRALDWTTTRSASVVTTEGVLTELGNFLAAPPNRQVFADLLSELRADAATEVVESSSELFQAGVDLYGQRLDKSWSLVDCMSFHKMQQRGIREALSTDHHFQQAGFAALLATT